MTSHITRPGLLEPNTELMRSIRHFLTRLSMWGLAAAVFVACTTTTDPVPAATIRIGPVLDSIEIGATYAAWSVILEDAAGNELTGRRLAWESSNPTIATIDPSTGVATGVDDGQAVITVRSEGLSATSTLRVLVPVISIVVVPDSFDLPLTTTRAVTATVVGPAGIALTNRQIIWATDNPSVAVVSTTGVVTAVTVGTTTISVKAGPLTKQIRVRVVAEPVASVRILPLQSVHVIRLGQTKQLTAECLNGNQQVLTGRAITWNSANPISATVSQSGLVTAHAVGNANITATCDGSVSATVSAQVTPVPVSSVAITPNGLTIADNSQGQLTAVARDSANNVLSLQGRQVNWISSNLPVASVNQLGVVAASNPGATEITVSVDGVLSPPVTVTVTAFLAAHLKPADAPWVRRADLAGR